MRSDYALFCKMDCAYGGVSITRHAWVFLRDPEVAGRADRMLVLQDLCLPALLVLPGSLQNVLPGLSPVCSAPCVAVGLGGG
jgi:hypothetical protein